MIFSESPGKGPDRVVEIRTLSYSANQQAVFKGLNLEIARGDSYALWGPSGSGKSLLLMVLAGLIPVAPGTVFVEKTDLASAGKRALQDLRIRLGFVFQEGALISNLSLYDNIALPLRYHKGLPEREVRDRVGEIMNRLEVDREFDRSLPAQVGREVRKRAALARALILKPSFLLLDEPTAGLGEEAVRQVVAVIKDYREGAKGTVLFTTSDQSLTLALANRAGFLREGRIFFEGTPLEMRDKMREEGFWDHLQIS